MGVMLWIVVFVFKGTFRTIPTVGSYGAGVFCSRQNLIAVKLFNRCYLYVGYKTEKFTLPVLPLTVLVR
jgi:hypothetical protein